MKTKRGGQGGQGTFDNCLIGVREKMHLTLVREGMHIGVPGVGFIGGIDGVHTNMVLPTGAVVDHRLGLVGATIGDDRHPQRLSVDGGGKLFQTFENAIRFVMSEYGNGPGHGCRCYAGDCSQL